MRSSCVVSIGIVHPPTVVTVIVMSNALRMPLEVA